MESGRKGGGRVARPAPGVLIRGGHPMQRYPAGLLSHGQVTMAHALSWSHPDVCCTWLQHDSVLPVVWQDGGGVETQHGARHTPWAGIAQQGRGGGGVPTLVLVCTSPPTHHRLSPIDAASGDDARAKVKVLTRGASGRPPGERTTTSPSRPESSGPKPPPQYTRSPHHTPLCTGHDTSAHRQVPAAARGHIGCKGGASPGMVPAPTTHQGL